VKKTQLDDQRCCTSVRSALLLPFVDALCIGMSELGQIDEHVEAAEHAHE
jgi:hypothetical protein